MALAHKHGQSDWWVVRMLQKAEGVVEGMLMVLDLRLEMDADSSK
ncbi:antitermination protein, partial [Escherichia coli]|nr:antitermination protein [Escherichia coli]